MKRIISVICALALSACATLGNPQTPSQKLYAGLSVYGVAVKAAADYAESPNANPGVVRALDQVANNDATQTALSFARAYVVCKGRNEGTFGLIVCASMDFTERSVTAKAFSLASAAKALTAPK